MTAAMDGMGKTNPEKNQNRFIDLFGVYRKYGYVMFPQQLAIYNNIASYIQHRTVLEAGCGNGIGTAILERFSDYIIGTDKLESNIKFASCLYPWIEFKVWDLNKDTNLKADVVVCIEAIEHVTDPYGAMRRLIDAAEEEVWISTPNGRDKPRPPENPYHVCEYTTAEIIDMIMSHPASSNLSVTIHSWENLYREDSTTLTDPLVYRIQKDG